MRKRKEGERARKESEVEYWQLAVGMSWQLVSARLELGWMEPKIGDLGVRQK